MKGRERTEQGSKSCGTHLLPKFKLRDTLFSHNIRCKQAHNNFGLTQPLSNKASCGIAGLAKPSPNTSSEFLKLLKPRLLTTFYLDLLARNSSLQQRHTTHPPPYLGVFAGNGSLQQGKQVHPCPVGKELRVLLQLLSAVL